MLNKTTKLTQFKLLCLLIAIIGLGISVYINSQSRKIVEVQNSFIPTIAMKSFFLGCMGGSNGNLELCKQLSESHRLDIESIIQIGE